MDLLSQSDWDAATYAENNQIQRQWVDRFFFRSYRWKGDEKVLDIGCGDGKLTAYIAKQIPNGQVTGWDASSSMIEHAQRHYISPNLAFLLRDASLLESYKDEANQFDLIVSFHALHWIDEPIEALKGIAYALKPGGKAYLLVTADSFDPLLFIADELMEAERWRDHFQQFQNPLRRFNAAQYTALLQQADLTPVQVRAVSQDDLLSSKEELAKQIISWLPHIKFLKKGELQAEFLNQMIDRFMEMICPGKKEPTHLSDCNLEIIAEKRQ